MSQPTPDRAQVQAALQNAQIAFNQGNFDVAEPIYAQYMPLIPPDSEEYALCLHNMGEISEARGNVANAIWCQTRLLTHSIMKHMSMAPHLLSRMGHVATLYEKTGQYDDAQSLYRQMHELKDQAAAIEGKAPPPPINSELTTFLLTLLDNAHRKFSQDPMQINSTRKAFESLRPRVASAADNLLANQAPPGAGQGSFSAAGPVGGWVSQSGPSAFSGPSAVSDLQGRISGSQPQQPTQGKNFATTRNELPAQTVPPSPPSASRLEPPAQSAPKLTPQFDLSGYVANQQETGRFFPKQMEHLQQTSGSPAQPVPQPPMQAQSQPLPPQPLGALNKTDLDSSQPSSSIIALEAQLQQSGAKTGDLGQKPEKRSEKQSWESGWNSPPADEIPELFEKEEEPPLAVPAPVEKIEDKPSKKRELVPKEDRPDKGKKEAAQPKKMTRRLESKGAQIVAPINFAGPSERGGKSAPAPKNVSVGPPQFLPPVSYKAPKALKPKEFKRDSLLTAEDILPKAAPARKESKPDWTEQIKSAGSPKKGGTTGGGKQAKGGAAPPRDREEPRGGGSGARGRLSFDMGGDLDSPSEANEDFQNMMTGVTKLMNNKLAPVAIGMFVLVVVIIIVALPYKHKPEEVFKTMPRNFNTVDEARAINFSSLGDCELRSGSAKAHIAFKYFLTDWRESIGMAFAPLAEKQYWINDTHDTIDKQEVHAYLKDEVGNVYYPISAPELKTVRSMQEIARKLGEWYLKHFLKYPKDPTEFGGDELTYENSVTHEKEQADWQSPIIVGSRESAREANYARAQFYENLSHGKGWENERKLAPGSINCCAVTFMAPGGNYQGLIIRGADHRGEPIKGSHNGDSFYVAYEDNKEKRDKLDPLPFLADGTMRKKEIVIFEEPVSSGFTFMVKSAACWLFVGLAFFGACVYLSLPKKSRFKIAAIGFIAFTGIMAALYTVAPRM
jgi:hypothetical protein